MTVRELEIRVLPGADAPVIDLIGELNAAGERALDAAYREAIAGGVAAVVLDFTRVDYINSSGIALIVGVLGQARSRGIEVRARGLSEHYREIFEITRLADFLTILDDDTSAADGADGNNHA